MKILIGIILQLLLIGSVLAEESTKLMQDLADNYFKAFVASQAPQASEKDLDNYLSLLADNVGFSHLPYVTDDGRYDDGKASIRKGMLFYLGAHTEYNAELLNVFIFNTSAIAIRYRHSAKGIHPQSKQPIAYTSIEMELLEIENNKVAVIRKYNE